MAQYVAQLRMEIRLLMKQVVTMNIKKLNVVGELGKAPRSYYFDVD